VTVMRRFTSLLSNMGTPGAGASFARTAAAGQIIAYAALAIMVGLILVSFGGMGGARALARRFPFLGRSWSWLAWNVPIASRLVRRRAVSRWALVAGELMDAGLPTHEALLAAASSGGNLCLDDIMTIAAGGVAEGMPLSAAIRRADPKRHLPPEVAWYIETGERSGRLEEALARVSQSAAARSRSSLGHLVTLVLPLGVLLVALSVGTQTYAIFGAISSCTEAAREQSFFADAPKSTSAGPQKQALPKRRSKKQAPRRSGEAGP